MKGMLLASRQKLSSRDVCLECACEGFFFEGARAGEEKQKHTNTLLLVVSTQQHDIHASIKRLFSRLNRNIQQ